MRRQRGFTLIELMVAILVSAIVMLGIFAFSSIQSSNATAHERNVRIQQSLEGAMWTIGQDVRQAGLGFSRLCTEIRVWDPGTNQLINPGGSAPGTVVDAVTNQPYWVLRDGLQAHWSSNGATTIDGGAGSSAAPGSAADSFDVMLGEPNYSNAVGVFDLADPVDGGDTTLSVQTSVLLDSTNTAHLEQVQQLFPPGTFVLVASRPGIAANPVQPSGQGQCVLLQVTDDVSAGADAQRWEIPIGAESGFNAGLAQLVADDGNVPACASETPACADDWDANTLSAAMVVPLGRLRWSRYELDYFVPTLPYLVRYDLIAWQDGDPLDSLATENYPHCGAGQCNAPQLHLPGSNSPPQAVAIAPMIEDMQVAVGCDGWSDAGAIARNVRIPDLGFAEVGPASLPGPNVMVDENSSASGLRGEDEWLGNALVEQLAPDCVSFGTAEANVADWETVEGTVGPGFRMSPQTMRLTLVGSDETPEAAGGLATDQLQAVEDRPELPSLVGIRQRFTLTERYSPENLHWRDSTVQ